MFILPTKSGATIAQLVGAISDARALSSSEIIALKAELTKDPESRGYAGKDTAEVLALLCLPYSQDNPAPQGRVNKAAVPGSVVRRFISVGLPIVEASPTLAAKWLPKLPIILGLIDAVVDLANPDMTLQSTLHDAIADGIYTAEDWAAITTDPDPTWQATYEMDPRASALLDLRWVMLDLADVAALRAA